MLEVLIPIKNETVVDMLKCFNTNHEAKEIGRRGLHEARKAGESLSRLREAYWREAQGGKKVGWKNYVKEEFVDVYRISYPTLCEYVKVYVNWDAIVEHGWDTKTYSQVVYKILPLYKAGKPIPEDINDPQRDANVAEFLAEQHVDRLRQETTRINYLKEQVDGLTVQRDKYKGEINGLIVQVNKYKAKYLSLAHKLNISIEEE